MLPDLETLTALVRQSAEQELVPRFAACGLRFKADGSIVTEADLAMQQRLSDALAAHWPHFQLLGEEMSEPEQHALLERADHGLWCLDPLDGTSNFAAGVPFFAVSLALLVKGEVVLGLVYDPVRRECFTARRGEGAWLNGKPLERLGSAPTLALKRCLAAVDFKRLPKRLALRLAEQPPYASQRSFGSVALDWCWVAAGRFHVYLHGRQKLWDYAAGSLVLAEAGGHATTLEGDEVFRAELQPRSAVAALSPALFSEWVQWLATASAGQVTT
ncbi:MAG: inositol monophosphatase [Gammaproteobacteria bacterium SG8_47]|nr:MAG: inositol monophosphatase [Gammaproteobacteria bacterium SG8_47]